MTRPEARETLTTLKAERLDLIEALWERGGVTRLEAATRLRAYEAAAAAEARAEADRLRAAVPGDPWVPCSGTFTQHECFACHAIWQRRESHADDCAWLATWGPA